MSDARAPIASILLASYNHARFVRQAVESVWAQSRGDIELIVIDDGSSDGSPAILQELASRSPIPMKLEVQENRGLTRTLNRALSLARGELVCLLASDDYYEPHFVERHVAEAQRHAGPAIIHSDAWIVDENGNVGDRIYSVSPTPPAEGRCFEEFATLGARVVAGTVVLPRRVLLDAGGYDPTMRCEDFDLYLKLSREIPFVYIDEPLYFSRELPGSLGRRPWVWAEGTVAAIEKHRDFLGERYERVLLKRLTDMAYVCSAHGGYAHAFRWAARSVAAAGTSTSRLTATALALKAIATGTTEHAARHLIPARPRKFVARSVRRALSRTSEGDI